MANGDFMLSQFNTTVDATHLLGNTDAIGWSYSHPYILRVEQAATRPRVQGVDICAIKAKAAGYGVIAEAGQAGIMARGDVGVIADGRVDETGVSGKGWTAGVDGFAEEVGVIGTGHKVGVRGVDFGSLSGSIGIGIWGSSLNHIGVYGSSTKHISGVYCECGKAFSRSRGMAAGFFAGPVIAIGDLTVYGAKHAAVPHRDGTHRLLYAVESPESWFEDFGQARLECGRAKVKIEPEFAALIRRAGYYVFLTACSECNGIFVSRRNSGSFEVRELKNGKSNALFCYRIVARRKDIQGKRLAGVPSPSYWSKAIKIPRLSSDKTKRKVSPS
jgi:hypothetical protein